MPGELERRSILSLGAGVFAALAGAPTMAKAPGAKRIEGQPRGASTREEAANVKTVEAFFSGFANPELDLDAHAARFFAPDCSVRWTQYMPSVTGPEAAAAQMKPLMTKGSVAHVESHEAFAKGPVVVMSRLERLDVPGKAPMQLSAVTIHVLRDGKFVEYAEWMLDLPGKT